jgi:DNA primase
VLAEILPHLKRVRQHGQNYRASCPIHGEDKDPSLSLTERDGKVLIHCFVCGASGLDVVQELELKSGVLFSDELPHDPDWLLKKTKDEDAIYCLIYESAKARGDVIRAKEFQRYNLALKRNKIRENKGL